MRVAHVIVGLGVGGAELMLRRLVLGLRDTNEAIESSVISLTSAGRVGAMLRGEGIDVRAVGMRGLADAPATFCRLRALFRELRPALVQTWMVHADLLGGLAARREGVPVVAWGVRTTDYRVESRSTRAVRWLCARLSRRIPDAVICAAEASRAEHVRAGYDAGRMRVVPNGFDIATLRSHAGCGARVRAEAGIAADAPLVGFVGRYNPAKDPANFVAAAGRLARRDPAVRFLMAGRGVDPANAELAALLAASGFRERFVLLGERDDIEDCLDALDVFALSSCSEGFPNVVGEAMALGLPCAATDVGDARLLLADTGRIVPPRDPEALAAAMHELLALSAAQREALGERAMARVGSEFSIDAACERYAEVYRQLLEHAMKRRTERRACAG